jgi:hypothetical protein
MYFIYHGVQGPSLEVSGAHSNVAIRSLLEFNFQNSSGVDMAMPNSNRSTVTQDLFFPATGRGGL